MDIDMLIGMVLWSYWWWYWYGNWHVKVMVLHGNWWFYVMVNYWWWNLISICGWLCICALHHRYCCYMYHICLSAETDMVWLLTTPKVQNYPPVKSQNSFYKEYIIHAINYKYHNIFSVDLLHIVLINSFLMI